LFKYFDYNTSRFSKKISIEEFTEEKKGYHYEKRSFDLHRTLLKSLNCTRKFLDIENMDAKNQILNNWVVEVEE